MTGNDAYAAERARLLARAGDPQGTRPGHRSDAANPDRPCTCTGDDGLPHNGYLHDLTDAAHATKAELVAYAVRRGLATEPVLLRATRGELRARFRGQAWRTYCTVAAPGPCPCEHYQPVTERTPR